MALTPGRIITSIILLLALFYLLSSPSSSSSSSSSSADSREAHRPPRVQSQTGTVSSVLQAETDIDVEDSLRRQDARDRVREALEALGTVGWGDFAPEEGRWANVTGLRREHGFVGWEGLDSVRERVRAMSRSVIGDVGEKRYLGAGVGEELDDVVDETDALRDSWLMYRNISGYITGKWARVPPVKARKTASAVNLTAIYPEGAYSSDVFGRNVSGDTGLARIRFFLPSTSMQSSEDGTVTEIKAHLMLRHNSPRGDEIDVSLHGVHFLEYGGIMLTTSSEKFAGIFSLPMFSPSPYTFRKSQALLNETLRKADADKTQDSTFVSNSWSKTTGTPVDSVFQAPQCDYIVYLQQHPTESDGRKMSVAAIELEMEEPTGMILSKIPSIKMSMLAFSPDCGTILESQGPPDHPQTEGVHLQGPQLEALIVDSRHLLTLVSVIVALQLWLTLRQMKDSSTPSTRSRVSYRTLVILAMGDGFVCMMLLPITFFAGENVQILQAVGFFSFLLVVIFGMKFVVDVWSVQVAEERTRSRQQQSSQSQLATSTSGPAAVDSGLPLPVTAARPVAAALPPMIVRSDGELESDVDAAAAAAITTTTNDTPTGPPTSREVTAVHVRFFLFFLLLIFTSFSAITWPLSRRRLFSNLISSLYLSPWLPQIYRNVMRNCRKALRWDYVAGHSLLRLLLLAYFYGMLRLPTLSRRERYSCDTGNVFLIDTADPVAFAALSSYLWLQVLLLLSQQLLGPRFFVRASWVPPAYDYHPLLHESDEEGGSFPAGLTSPQLSRRSAEIKRDKSKRVFDCAVCMQHVEVPFLPSAHSAAAAVHVPTSSPSSPTASTADRGGSTRASAAAATSFLARTAYMVTPCRHIFHTTCLEGWMRYRLICPVCRDTLPPV